ncbi:putative HTH-type transcriptional regulator [Paenibacillus allorhizoplanae]|uniref:HTH-type transcriptional regulator n=1 Tax=Paenibacillus allorhizoplanae TaxID=2905648 RepID=A0ABM9C6P0_9BACL|nr:MerR family transcriptional regulator [Paenibacillus allorhizoplanae]CAH1203698.1 putative HTH-type transcriptional regulator [Paenibacillus allorhizoplanae]
MSEAAGFSIKEAAEQSALSEDTIRYYEKIGLLPQADRKKNRHRIYHPEDLQVMQLITCLKKTGMSLDEMKPFLGLTYESDLTEHPDLQVKLQQHREKIQHQINSLQMIIDVIDSKMTSGNMLPEACELAEPTKRIQR